jgi:hypothetical protein
VINTYCYAGNFSYVCCTHGVLEPFELDDIYVSDWCRNEDVHGVDGVVCRELLNDALVTDL